MKNIYKMAQQSLLRAHLNNGGKQPDKQGYELYFDKHIDNLIPAISSNIWKEIEKDINCGAGNELKPKTRNSKEMPAKFNALHSSSALSVNTFGKWRLEPENLKLINTSGFSNMQFEKKMDTGFLGVPNLDVFFQSATHIIGLESKFLEFIQSADPKSQNIPASYSHKKFPFINDAQWWEAIGKYNGKEMRYPAAQLIKHYFGIKCFLKQNPTLADHKVTLLYLYWKPVNAADYPVYKDHDEELEDFSKTVNLGTPSIKFSYKTYSELWNTWDKLPGYAEHVSILRKRYEIPIE